MRAEFPLAGRPGSATMAGMETEAADNVWSVSQLTREIREVLEERIGTVWVGGEVSNHRLQASGHQYFTLKDEGAQVSCVLFRGAARLAARFRDGDQVELQGELSVYEPRGQYQLVVRQVRLKGQGGLRVIRDETSAHGLGLAIDINYASNPWVGGDNDSRAGEANAAFEQLARHALEFARAGVSSLQEVFRISASLEDGSGVVDG